MELWRGGKEREWRECKFNDVYRSRIDRRQRSICSERHNVPVKFILEPGSNDSAKP